jgi:L-ascorbate metabolism protein UlaG (beta-lactamase superfamily)
MAAIQLLRHATLLLDLDDTTFLVDPMLSEPGGIPPIPNSPNDRENPRVDLPDVDLTYDAVLVTHRHRDHFDDAAADQLPADVPILCQPEEAEEFREDGFTDVRAVESTISFEGTDVTRTPARHGHGELAEQMGPSSGYILDGSQTIYLAGDTVWYEAVAETVDAHDPDAVIVNAGAAQFVEGEPITMTPEEVGSVRETVADDVPVIADHMEAINHCLATRADLAAAVDGVAIPDDGERIEL